MTHGAEVPNSAGLGGGLPGGTIRQAITMGQSGRSRLGPKPGAFPITPADVFHVTWQGGGGLGDPLDRAPADVVDDVRRGVVSADAARDTYGVVLLPGGSVADPAADPGKTAALRRRLRARRLGVPESDVTDPVPVDSAEVAAGLRLTDRIVAVQDADSGQWQVRTLDGTVLAAGSTRWREGAHRFTPALPPAVASTLHPDLAVTAWADPRTGALLGIDVHLRDEAPLCDIDLDLASLAGIDTLKEEADA